MNSDLMVYLRRDGKSNIHLSDADKFESPTEAFNALMEHLQEHDAVSRLGEFRIPHAYKAWKTLDK